MGILKNERHELFAQELAKGSSAIDAYVAAGYVANDGNCIRLKNDPEVVARVEEILGRAAARAEVTVEGVLRELAKIGFSDIRKAIAWRSNVAVAAVDIDEELQAIEAGGEIRHQITNQVELIDSADIDDDTAAAIAEIAMTDKGGLRLKLHDKRGALVDLGRHLGMFKDRQVHENPDGTPLAAPAPVIIFQLPDNGRGG
jgi:phage terminase small subunit